MAAIKMKSYTSPTRILLVLDWEDGSQTYN
ncbi:hypothetical protein J2W42_003064 [Rhizobium tibeticum]|uniref:Uncharacterized protein n=1 Tax=Rhizobium tibeticum TaxID=501024 RepID=A0A1H8H218_9HYPH|nr:hypothetical protein [Rhizobium tibeticum]SEH63891.1 hypothetical protein RTCCBAU85039_1528 [Rhizobium tibeticum]SEN50286.1 hypothetical protein SAMN05216228_100520 [Rhizobium tibeticum]